MNKLQEIQERCQQKGYDTLSRKQILTDWLGKRVEQRFDMGLTLMPKKVFYKHKSSRFGEKNTQVIRHLNSYELVSASIKFVELLNRMTFKNAYKRYNRRLDIVMVTEGEQELRDAHSHFAISKPKTMPLKDFVMVVHESILINGEFEVRNPNYNADVDGLDEKYRYKLDLVDEGWITYITKKLEGKGFDNLYLP